MFKVLYAKCTSILAYTSPKTKDLRVLTVVRAVVEQMDLSTQVNKMVEDGEIIDIIDTETIDGHLLLQTKRGWARPSALDHKFAARLNPFLVLDFWDKTPGYAPVPCQIAGIFRPLPGSRHLKQKKA